MKIQVYICPCGCSGFIAPEEEKAPGHFHSKTMGRMIARELFAHKVIDAQGRDKIIDVVDKSTLPETSVKDSPRRENMGGRPFAAFLVAVQAGDLDS